MQASDNMRELSVSEIQMVSGGALIDVGLPDIPVFAFIGRLEEQKELNILADAIPIHESDGVEITLLGSGK